MLPLLIGLLFAALFLFLIYSVKVITFWLAMTVFTALLAIWSVIWAGEGRGRLFEFKTSYFIWGILSGIMLYILFGTGGKLAVSFFPSASVRIDAIYVHRGLLPVGLTMLLLIIIGSSEEIFWRGMVQRIIGKWFGTNTGWVLGAILYAGVNLLSANYILVIAAFVGGLYWGWLYRRFRSLWPGIISHVAWDLMIFLILPLK